MGLVCTGILNDTALVLICLVKGSLYPVSFPFEILPFVPSIGAFVPLRFPVLGCLAYPSFSDNDLFVFRLFVLSVYACIYAPLGGCMGIRLSQIG